jgi:hypothetical protein
MRNASIRVFGLLVVIGGFPVLAIDAIPEASGFGGFFLIAPGAFDVESNLIVVAEPPLLDDVGNGRIESIFEAPSSQSAASLLTAGELSYTFASTRTQLFLGNRIEDFLRLDVAFGVGVRQELPDKSILAISVLTTPTDVNVWSDPYVEGVDRVETDRDAPGVRLRWARIFKTGLEITGTFREYEHDEETSGDWLIDQGRLDPAQQALLDRNGKIWNVQFLYRIKSGSHVFEPTLRYTETDLDGAAMANNGPSVKLTYLYLTPKLIIDVNLLFHDYESNEVHPVYGETLDAERWGATCTVFWDLFKAKRWRAMASAEYVREEANIDFFDSKVAAAHLGAVWRFRRK